MTSGNSPATQFDVGQWRRIFDAVGSGIRIIDLEHRVLHVNESFCRLSGVSYDEAISGTCHEGFPGSACQTDDFPLQQVIDGKEAVKCETIKQATDGSDLHCIVSASPLRDENGQVIGIVEDFREISELKRTEQELENIFRLSPDMIAVCTTEGGFLNVSPSWEPVLGYTHKELLDLGWANLVHPDDVERTSQEVERQLKGGTVASFVNRYRCKDGSYKTLEWQASLAMEGIVHATARDITERKKIETALRESEELHRITLSDISDAVFITDDAGNFTFVCPNAHVIFGHDRDEVLGMRNIQGLLGENLFDRKQLDKDGELVNLERRVTNKFAVAHDLLINVKQVSIQGGTTLYSCRDITERKRAEEALRKSEARFRTLVDSAPIAVYETDAQGACLYANQNWLALAGLTLEEALGDGWQKSLHEEDKENIFALWKRHADGDTPWDLEYRFCAPDGKVSWVMARAIALRDDSGQITGYLGANVDITKRKEAEVELKQHRDNLERLVSDRTADLRRSEEKFRLLTETSVMGVYIIQDGQIIYVNPSFAQVFGYEREEIVGNLRPVDLVHPDDREFVSQDLKDRQAGKFDGASIAYKAIKKDGTPVRRQTIRTCVVEI